VAWGGQRAKPEVSDRDLVPGSQGVASILANETRPVFDCARGLDQARASRDVVCVIVRLDDMRDSQALGASDLHVFLDLPARVDDHRLAAIPEQVRGTSEITMKHLPEEHAPPFQTIVN
jgi:hypothetical protein